MKKRVLTFLFLMFGIFFTNSVLAQCTPADSISCPDPENNGQVCPDSLDVAYKGEYYEQVFSILPPYETTGIVFTIHHLHLVDVGNLPESITWVSNTEDNDFYPGTYYCVLMSGTPADTGTYPLHIEVEVFGELNGTPVSMGTVTDSTSLSLVVEESNGVADLFVRNSRMKLWPNPFINKTNISYRSPEPGQVQVVVSSLQGKELESCFYTVEAGENKLPVNLEQLAQGHYVITLVTSSGRISDIAVKTR